MGATMTTPRVSRETLEDRWSTLMYSVETVGGDPKHSDLNDRLFGAIREAAGRMIHGVQDVPRDGSDPRDYDFFDEFTERLFQQIRDEMIGYAEQVEDDRAAR